MTLLLCTLYMANKTEVPVGHATVTFKFNQSFIDPPIDGAPEPIWDSLMPGRSAVQVRVTLLMFSQRD